MTTIQGNCYMPPAHFPVFAAPVSSHAVTLAAVDLLRQIMEQAAFRAPSPQTQLPGCACLPPPRMDLGGVPAGRGLCTDAPEGWPEDTITTAGGYRIVPTGESAAWEIYAPDQEYADKPMTRVWGDPHVDEGDGTRWDFTKDGDFMLPDGTRIHCDTTAQTGFSISQHLTIWNGNDRVEVRNVNSRDPQVSEVHHDGYRTRAEHMAKNRDMFTFILTGDSENQQWVRSTSGELEGVITGAYYDHGEQVYKQKVDEGNIPRVALGSQGWGNGFRGAVLDQRIDQFMDRAEALYGEEAAQWLGGRFAEQAGARFEQNHYQNMFGGWFNAFPSFDSGWQAVSSMQQVLMAELLLSSITNNFRFVDRGRID